MTPEQVAQELVRRRLAMSSVDDYATYLSSSQHLDFLHAPAKHHRIITRAIDALLTPRDAPNHPKDRWGEPVTRLLLTAPPGAAKSTYCSVQVPTYILAKHPDWHLLCASNITDLAENFNRRRRAACRTPEWETLAETTLDPEAMGVDRFYTRRGGSVAAAGVGKAIVGIRSNVNILDDPIKSWEEAQSETQLAKIWDWYETEYRSRLVPQGYEILMHQRWSRNDPAGVLQRLIKTGEERGWMVINIPMVAPEAVDPENPDPLNRAPGEVLWPEWFTQKQVTEAQRDPAKWAALYQQHPLDEEGAWVGPEFIHYISPADWRELRRNHRYKYLAAGDLALSINKGDWTVFLIAAITPDRDIIFCDMVRHRKSIEDSVSELFKLNEIYRPAGWFFDDDNATKVFMKLVYERSRTSGEAPPPLVTMPIMGRDKEIRAAAIRGYFRGDRVSIVNDSRWAPDLVREVLGFPGEPNDIIDTAGLIGRKMVVVGPGETIERPESKPIQGLIVDKEGQMYLNLSLDTLFEQNERGKVRWNSRKIQ